MVPRHHMIFWTLVAAGFVAIVALLGSVLLPFVLGATIAYLLNPLVGKISRPGYSRRVAALLILGFFFMWVAVIAAAVLPELYEQVAELCRNIPLYIERLWNWMEPFSRRTLALLGHQDTGTMQGMLQQQVQPALEFTGTILLGLIAGGQAFLHVVSVIVITPVVAYFMMKEWPHITSWTISLMPPKYRDTILGLLKDIDKKLAGFIRGQLGVMFVLGLGYAVLLSLMGLKYGFLIGLGAGLLSVIPLVGSSFGFITALAVAFFQTGGDLTYMLLIAGIFVGGQLIEGNFLTPVLVGESVGLHPLWIFFALLAGGALFGIVGMLLAVPVAAVVSVLAAFAIRQYKASPYYKGGP